MRRILRRKNLLWALFVVVAMAWICFHPNPLAIVPPNKSRLASFDAAIAASDDVVVAASQVACIQRKTETPLPVLGRDRQQQQQQQQQQQHQHSPICLVHLGKTAGSTITCLMNRTVQTSGKGNSQCSSDDFFQKSSSSSSSSSQSSSLSTVARHVTHRVHLEPAPVDDFDAFLLTLRNPLDRIISWYFYLHPHYPPPKLARHQDGCHGYHEFFQECWPTLQAFTNVGLAPIQSTTTGSSYQTKDSKSQPQPALSRIDNCQKLAWEMATGQRHCWHNYWNYNRTYSPLLVVDVPKTIYTIRTEHMWEDWNKLNAMLLQGGNESDRTQQQDLVAKSQTAPEPRIHKNQFHLVGANRTLDVLGRNNLCRALCHEIQIYKQLLSRASNLCDGEREQSLAELFQSCPSETAHVRHDCTMEAIR